MITLADAILQEDFASITHLLRQGEAINQIDEYGFTPLIESTIIDNQDIAKLLLSQGADPNQQDVTGGTALQWAVENNNEALCQLLIKHRANVNAYNLSGQPVLTMPMLRKQSQLRKLLVANGADVIFAQDYINIKLLGHLFELVGTANIISPDNQFVEVDFEGFYLEVTLGIIADSLYQFQNHFAARNLRRYASLSQYIVEILNRAGALIKYQQYRVDRKKYQKEIDANMLKEPLLIPVGYEGHAITFIKRGDIWVKCDRREDSRLYDNIVFYRITRKDHLDLSLLKNLIYKKSSSQFINEELDDILGLEPITELKVDAQISGNCSWANVEAAIPAIFFMVLMQAKEDAQAIQHYKTLSLNYFARWREWNKDRALHLCIKNYYEGDAIRRACKAEILAAILFQRCDIAHSKDRERLEIILSVLLNSPYEYIIKNYLRVYYTENYTEEGKRFAEMLKQYGYQLR